MPFSERDISLALISSLGTALMLSLLVNNNSNNGYNDNNAKYRRDSYRRSRSRKSRDYYDDEDDDSYYDEESEVYPRYHDDHSDDDSGWRHRRHARRNRHDSKRSVTSRRKSMDTLLTNNLSYNIEDQQQLPQSAHGPIVDDSANDKHNSKSKKNKFDEKRSTPKRSNSNDVSVQSNPERRLDENDFGSVRSGIVKSRRHSDDASLTQSVTSEVVSISKNGKTRRRRQSTISTGSIGSNSDAFHVRHRAEVVSLTSKEGVVGRGSIDPTTHNNRESLRLSTGESLPGKSEDGTQTDGTSTLNTASVIGDATLNSENGENQLIANEQSSDTANAPEDNDAHDDEDDEEDEEEEGINLQLLIGVDESDKLFQEFTNMDQILNRTVTTIEQSLSLLRRARCVNVMGNKLMLAESETQCFEQVSKLLVSLFKVERSTYTLMIDEDHFTILHCTVTQEDFANQLCFELAETGLRAPLKGTAIEYCKETLEALYTPLAKHSRYIDHQKLMTTGLKSFVNVPILVGEQQFAGCLNIGLAKEDPFTELDISLIHDIATMLGTHVYSKRLQRCRNESHQISQQLLHSFIPPQIIEKIEHYWAPPSSRNSAAGTLGSSSMPRDDFPRSISLPEESVESINQSKKERFTNIKGKLELLQEYGGNPSKSQNQLKYVSTNDDASISASISGLRDVNNIVSQTDENGQGSTSHALYAENADDISIIFSDIVGFSKMSLDVPPIMIMDMLQHLFHRYDVICKKYGMHKLETIGDAYLCSAGLLEHDIDDNPVSNKDRGKNAAIRALAMAKDMVREARKVPVPKKNSSGEAEFLEVRVGIHVGEVTYGVLGQTIPKLVCIGNTVNMAARMEQNSCSSKIRVTQDFHDLVGDEETGWEENQIVAVKNMGKVSSWLLDPLKKSS